MEYQKISDPLNEQRLFAVGKFQFIPSTLRELVDSSGISTSTVFNPETQNKLAMQAIFNKRPILGAYFTGQMFKGKQVTTEEAAIALAQEWASFPVPRGMYDHKGVWRNAGESYHGNGNKASHPVQGTLDQIEQIRAQTIRQSTLPPISNPQASVVETNNTVASTLNESNYVDAVLADTFTNINNIIRSNNLEGTMYG